MVMPVQQLEPGSVWQPRGPGQPILSPVLQTLTGIVYPWLRLPARSTNSSLGRLLFQETDFSMTLPIVKHSYLVLTAEDLPKIVKEAFYLAESGRPGPVVIDIPKDV